MIYMIYIIYMIYNIYMYIYIHIYMYICIVAFHNPKTLKDHLVRLKLKIGDSNE